MWNVSVRVYFRLMRVWDKPSVSRKVFKCLDSTIPTDEPVIEERAPILVRFKFPESAKEQLLAGEKDPQTLSKPRRYNFGRKDDILIVATGLRADNGAQITAQKIYQVGADIDKAGLEKLIQLGDFMDMEADFNNDGRRDHTLIKHEWVDRIEPPDGSLEDAPN
jgi:hypothetical protein